MLQAQQGQMVAALEVEIMELLEKLQVACDV